MCRATKIVQRRWNKCHFSYRALFIPPLSSSLPKPFTPTNCTLHEHVHLLVCVWDRIIRILPCLHSNSACVCMRTHWHTHAPTQRKPKHSNPQQLGLYESHIFRIYLHTTRLTAYPLKSYQTKKYIPSVKLSLSRGFATTTWAPF